MPDLGLVAQSVAQMIENPCAGFDSGILPFATVKYDMPAKPHAANARFLTFS
jgi:hypothetical protein